MFTGIIEQLGKIEKIEEKGDNLTFHITSTLAPQLSVDESVCHNGICLTVEEKEETFYTVTAIYETLKKTNAGTWQIGDIINLERAMKYNGRLDGHIVQGHVDDTAQCIKMEEKEGSTQFTFQFHPQFVALIIEKGSVCLNGVSLTVFDVQKDQFTVAIIPYTFNHTNFKQIKMGSVVNIEFDVIGKYILRYQELKS